MERDLDIADMDIDFEFGEKDKKTRNKKRFQSTAPRMFVHIKGT